jgi:hypothetical protein
MYLETKTLTDRLERLMHRAQANNAEGLARVAENVTAKLSGSIAVAQLSAPEEPPQKGERRRSRRFSTESEIHARRMPGANFEVALGNVSALGCRLEMLEQCAEGEDVIARFPKLEPIRCRVRWTAGRRIGLEFVRPIHPAVFGSLLGRLSLLNSRTQAIPR